MIMIEMRQRIDRANAEKEIEETIQVSALIYGRSERTLTCVGNV